MDIGFKAILIVEDVKRYSGFFERRGRILFRGMDEVLFFECRVVRGIFSSR